MNVMMWSLIYRIRKNDRNILNVSSLSNSLMYGEILMKELEVEN